MGETIVVMANRGGLFGYFETEEEASEAGFTPCSEMDIEDIMKKMRVDKKEVLQVMNSSWQRK